MKDLGYRNYTPDYPEVRKMLSSVRGPRKGRPGFVTETPAYLRRRTLAHYLRTVWLRSVQFEVEPSSFNGYRQSVESYLDPELGHIPLKDLSRDIIKAFYVDLLVQGGISGRPLRNTTVERVHATLHRALQTAVEAEVLAKNPASGARPKRRASDEFEGKIWSPKELATFERFAQSDRLYALWRIFAWTGMRRGEGLGLKWGDLRLDARCVAVRRALVETEGSVYLTLPKRNQIRVIELDGETIAVVKCHRRKMAAERRTSRLPRATDDDFVFTRPDGEHLNPSRVTHKFNDLVEASGLPRIRLHDLRHTHASHLLEAGANIKVVQERLGHADVVITLKIYAHLLPNTQRRAVEGLTRFYNQHR
jgi:integrase